MIILKQKTGLVLEGGGMRGVYTSGVHEYLLDQGIYFPYVIGVSAGASNSFNYVARQKGRGKRVNLDYVSDWRYMSLRSLIFRGSYFGMDFLFGDIPERLDPFDYDTFFHYPGSFPDRRYQLPDRTGRLLQQGSDDTGDAAPAGLLLLAAPVACCRHWRHPYLDGGVADPIPVRKALT